MLIKNISIKNFRVYKDLFTLTFDNQNKENIHIISGENGFGKTTFLLALMWCLYGKQLPNVDDSLKSNIHKSGGYKQFLLNSLNSYQKNHLKKISTDKERKEIKKNGYSKNNTNLKKHSIFSIEMVFEKVVIPSILCDTVSIIRQFDCITEKENIQVLIDGKENELCKEIGHNIFINDFILNHEIARFFFFDSEKIISIAEISSETEKRKLNSAYNQVLGVKKYEELRDNLLKLRLRFRQKSNDVTGKKKLRNMISEKDNITKQINDINESISIHTNTINKIQEETNALLIELTKEGSPTSHEDFNRQKRLLEVLHEKDILLKSKFTDVLEMAPLAIVGDLLNKTLVQAKKEKENNDNTRLHNNQIDLITKIHKDLNNDIVNNDNINLDLEQIKYLKTRIWHILKTYIPDNKNCKNTDKNLLYLSKDQYLELSSIIDNIKGTFKIQFQYICDDYVKNKQIKNRTSRRISQEKLLSNNIAIQNLRNKKISMLNKQEKINKEITSLTINKGKLLRDLDKLKLSINKLSKTVSIDGMDSLKDKIAARLISNLENFLYELKNARKHSLEQRIKNTLNTLMHKKDFVKKVSIDINNDLIDIVLYDKNNQEIKTEVLSKGEQQLFATAILKSLVDESKISFPIFIDSPLQKFDKRHSETIINNFYPVISKQVVLFPLLHKELTLQEYDIMKPYINSTFKIFNNKGNSRIMEISKDKLFNN